MWRCLRMQRRGFVWLTTLVASVMHYRSYTSPSKLQGIKQCWNGSSFPCRFAFFYENAKVMIVCIVLSSCLPLSPLDLSLPLSLSLSLYNRYIRFVQTRGYEGCSIKFLSCSTVTIDPPFCYEDTLLGKLIKCTLPRTCNFN